MPAPRAALPFLVLVALTACGGGGSSSPSSTNQNPAPTLDPAVATTTITIGSGGRVTPNNITISVGQRVTFVNQHPSAHEIASDPHPNHTNCPQINALNSIGPGVTAQTAAFGSAAVCGFHDHNDPTNTDLRGRITIQ